MAPEPSPCYKESSQNENACNMQDGCRWTSGENQGSTDMPTDEPGSNACVEEVCSDQQNEDDCKTFMSHEGDMCTWDSNMNMCTFMFIEDTTTKTTTTEGELSECYKEGVVDDETKCNQNNNCVWKTPITTDEPTDLGGEGSSCQDKSCDDLTQQMDCENFAGDSCKWGIPDGETMTMCYFKDDLISDTTTTTEIPGGGGDGEECYAFELDTEQKCNAISGCVWEDYSPPFDSTDLPGGGGSCVAESCSTQKTKTTCESYGDNDCEWDVVNTFCSDKGGGGIDGITDNADGSSSGSSSGSGGDLLTDPPPGPCDAQELQNDEPACNMKTECEWLKIDTTDDTPGDIDGYCAEITCISQKTSLQCTQFGNGDCKWVIGQNGDVDYCVNKGDDVDPTDSEMTTTDDTLGETDCTKYSEKNMCEQNGCVFKPFSTKMTTKPMTMSMTKSNTPGACPSDKYDARGVFPDGTPYQRCVGSLSCRGNLVQFGKLKGGQCKCEDKKNCFYCKRTAQGDECLRCKKYTYLSDGKCVPECPSGSSHVGVGGYGRYCSDGEFTCNAFQSSNGGPPCKCSNTATRPDNRASPCATCEFKAGGQGEKCLLCKKSMFLHWDTYTCHTDCTGQANKVSYAAGSYGRECRDPFYCENGQDANMKKCKCTGTAGKKNCYKCMWGLENGKTVNKCEVCWKDTYNYMGKCMETCPSGYQAVPGNNGVGGECQKM